MTNTRGKTIHTAFGSIFIPEVHSWDRSWQDFNASEQKEILEESAKQGAEDQDRLTNL